VARSRRSVWIAHGSEYQSGARTNPLVRHSMSAAFERFGMRAPEHQLLITPGPPTPKRSDSSRIVILYRAANCRSRCEPFDLTM
jgi:hypothetical protein